jgi:hypothetical protein
LLTGHGSSRVALLREKCSNVAARINSGAWWRSELCGSGAPRARARGAQRLSPLGNIMFATTLAVAMTPDSDVTDDALFALMIKRRWDQAKGVNMGWAPAALRNVTYDESMQRRPASAEDAPQHAPQLQRLFAQLDVGVARYVLNQTYQGVPRTAEKGADRAGMYRTGSVAVDLTQQAFYMRVAASPAVRHVCEVGFNAGHSTALWLSVNPTVTVDTFDLFSWEAKGLAYSQRLAAKQAGFMTPNLHLLQRLFPGRLTAHRGDSLKTVPTASLVRPCDLVHVDGRHSYGNVMADAMNLMRKSHPSALYLFDDQCDARKCSAPNAGVAAAPGLATCDMVLAGLLEPVASIFEGERQFALFRRKRGERARDILRNESSNQLPCEYCELRTIPARPELEVALRGDQRLARAKSCGLPDVMM